MSKLISFRGSKQSRGGSWTLTNGGLEAKRMEPWRVHRPLVADFCHFDEEQYPDPDLTEKLDAEPDPH